MDHELCYEGFLVKKSLTARLASPWATASSGSGMYSVEEEACTLRTIQLRNTNQRKQKQLINNLFGRRKELAKKGNLIAG